MTTNHRRPRGPVRMVCGALYLLLSVGLSGLGAANAAATPSAPQLSIAIDDGQTSVKTGDRLTYTITVQNMGSTEARALLVTQSVPSGMSFNSADSSGTVTAGSVRWTVTVKPSQKAVLHTSVTVTATPKDLLRLAATACAATSGKAPPLVCASHSDQLPAGAAARQKQPVAAAKSSSTHGSSTHGWWWAGGGIVLAVALGAGVLLPRRRRTLPSTAR